MARTDTKTDHRPGEVLLPTLLGLVVAAAAIALRLTISRETGGEQAIFSFPAIIIATLLFGARAGAAAGAACLLALWYYVVPPAHSFRLESASAAITLACYVLVASALVWAIGAMRAALARYRELAAVLETLVERRTSERNRVWDRSQELVAVVTSDGCIDTMNPALRHLLERSGNAPVSFASVLVPEDRPALQAALQTLARDGASTAFEARVASASGVIWVEWSAASDGPNTYFVGRDFTAEHDCTTRLHQSQKMEVVGQMTGGLAHDFANLLSPISMTLELLRRRHRDDRHTVTLIEAAEESTHRAKRLIERLLRFARPGGSAPAVMPLRTLLDDVTPLLRQVIGRRRLEVRIDDELRDVRVDPNEFDMALLNLAVNARDATGDDGTLTLVARIVDDRSVRISLTDDGHGMDAETLARATDPFFSTKGKDRGTGLGLPMIHNFAVAAGGSFRLESEPGVGTTASIYLPAFEPSDRAAELTG